MDPIHLHIAVTQFMGLEAKLLDEGRLDAWFALLDEDILYEAPLRHATGNRSTEIDRVAYRFKDDIKTLRTRIDRLATGFGFAEMPFSRTTRSVSSMVIGEQQDDVVEVSSTITLYRQRGIDEFSDTIHARRNDRIRITAEGLRLLSREIIFAEVSLSTPNLGIFF